MTGRLFIATIGFNDVFISNTLHTYGARRGDGLLLVVLSPIVAGVRRTIENISLLAARMGFAMHGYVEINPAQPINGIILFYKKMLEVAGEKGYEKVIADLSGGPRIIVISSFLALVMVNERLHVEVRVQNETGGEGDFRFPLELVKIMMEGLGVKRRILEIIAGKPGVFPEEIAELMGLSEKTVLNYLSQLSRQGLVARRGRRSGVYLTRWGRLVLGVYEG